MDLYKKLRLLIDIYSALVTVDTPEPVCRLIKVDTGTELVEARGVVSGVLSVVEVSYSFESHDNEVVYGFNGRSLLTIKKLKKSS